MKTKLFWFTFFIYEFWNIASHPFLTIFAPRQCLKSRMEVYFFNTKENPQQIHYNGISGALEKAFGVQHARRNLYFISCWSFVTSLISKWSMNSLYVSLWCCQPHYVLSCYRVIVTLNYKKCRYNLRKKNYIQICLHSFQFQIFSASKWP